MNYSVSKENHAEKNILSGFHRKQTGQAMTVTCPEDWHWQQFYKALYMVSKLILRGFDLGKYKRWMFCYTGLALTCPWSPSGKA